MREKIANIIANTKVRIVLTILLVFAIAGGIGTVYYFGQKNQSTTLKGTKSKASGNTLTTQTTCALEILIPTPSTPPTSTPIPTTPPPICLDNADIALVLDRSSTMTDNEADGRQKLAWAKDAAKAFVQTIQASGRTNVRISVTSFGAQGNDNTGTLAKEYNSTLHSELSSKYEEVIKAIDGIKYVRSGTCIQCGIRIGNSSLASSPNAKYMILLSDGMANKIWNGSSSNAKPAAIAEAKAPSVTYFAIGYGKSGAIDETTLKSIAGNSSNYIYKPNASDWAQGFIEILSKICDGGRGGSPTPIPSLTPTPAVCVMPPPKDPPIVECAPAGGTGSITWTWQPVPGATRYEVDIIDSKGKKVVDNNWQPAATYSCATGDICSYITANLPIGTYRSSIRAGSDGMCAPSEAALSSRTEIKQCSDGGGQSCTTSPVDIVLSLDRSGTMGTVKVNGKTKLDWEKNAAKTFVEVIQKQPQSAQKNIRVGVVEWAGDNNKVRTLPLTNNLENVKKFINSVSYRKDDVYTCMECGISSATNLLLQSKNRKYIIMMSDGIGNRIITSCDSRGTCKNPTPPQCTNDKYLSVHCAKADQDAIKMAEIVKNENISLFVVGYGTKSPRRILEDNLKSIAGAKNPENIEYYRYGGDETNWDITFANIAPQICKETIIESRETTKKATERNKKEGRKQEGKETGE